MVGIATTLNELSRDGFIVTRKFVITMIHLDLLSDADAVSIYVTALTHMRNSDYLP